MVDIIKSTEDSSWANLQLPEDYSQLDETRRQEFLSSGVKILAKKIEELGLGSHILGNVRLVNKLVNTPIGEKESIPVDEFLEAGVGFEYAKDIFTWAYNIDREPFSTYKVVSEADRAIVVGFLGKLDGFLNSKYNS